MSGPCWGHFGPVGPSLCQCWALTTVAIASGSCVHTKTLRHPRSGQISVGASFDGCLGTISKVRFFSSWLGALVNSASETIELNQRHRAAPGINIQRFGSASQNQRQRIN